MTTYARLINGYAVDVVTTPPALTERFHPEWLARQNFVVVPDGTKNNAADNGDGTFTNPPPPVIQMVDRLLAKADLISHLIAQLGGNSAGNSRFGAIIAAAKNSTDPAVAGMYEQYRELPAFTKAQAQAFLTAIRASGVPAGAAVTIAEITAVVANWPQQQQG